MRSLPIVTQTAASVARWEVGEIMTDAQQDTERAELLPPRWFGRELVLDNETDDTYVIAPDVQLRVFKNPYGRWDADLYAWGRRIPGTLGAESRNAAIRETEETALRQMQLWMRVCG